MTHFYFTNEKTESQKVKWLAQHLIVVGSRTPRLNWKSWNQPWILSITPIISAISVRHSANWLWDLLDIMSIKTVKGYNSGRICVSNMFGEYNVLLVCPLFLSCHEGMPETKPGTFSVLLLAYNPLYWHLGVPLTLLYTCTYIPASASYSTPQTALPLFSPSSPALALPILYSIYHLAIYRANYVFIMWIARCLFLFENISSMRAEIFFSSFYHYFPST